MKNARVFIVLLALTTLGMGLAQAADGKWQVNVKALRIMPADKSDAFEAPLYGGEGGTLVVGADDIDVSDETTIEVDIKYFVTPKWSLEVVLATQEHDVSVNGVGKIGTAKHLPPTISAQYHFNPAGRIRPYLGAGLNITFWTDSEFDDGLEDALGAELEVTGTSFGPAIGGGIDFFVNDNWLINLDAKWVMISGDVEAGGTKVTEVGIDPWLIGVGVGYRF